MCACHRIHLGCAVLREMIDVQKVFSGRAHVSHGAGRERVARGIGKTQRQSGRALPMHEVEPALAQSRLAAFTAVEQVEEKNAEGTEDRYRWRVTAAAYDERRETPNADASRDLNLRVRLIRVDSVVAWSAADGRARDVRLATLVLAAKP